MRPWWRARLNRRLAASQPSYSKPILTSTRYSTISPSVTTALDFTTSTVWMLRTVFDAVATAWRAASLHDRGLVPTISRMMITPTVHLPGNSCRSASGGHHATGPTLRRLGLDLPVDVAPDTLRPGGKSTGARGGGRAMKLSNLLVVSAAIAAFFGIGLVVVTGPLLAI